MSSVPKPVAHQVRVPNHNELSYMETGPFGQVLEYIALRKLTPATQNM